MSTENFSMYINIQKDDIGCVIPVLTKLSSILLTVSTGTM